MRPSRRVPVLLVSAALAAAPATAWAQGAGDAQYEDPFAGTDTGQTSTGAPDDAPPLTSTPQGGEPAVDPSLTAPPPIDEADTAGSGAGSGSGSGTATRTRQVDELPRTGLDTRAVVLLGLALTLAGIGLRLRTADERF